MEILVVAQRPGELAAARFSCRRKEVAFIDGQRVPLESQHGLGDAVAAMAPLRQGVDCVVLAADPALFSFRDMELPLRDRRKLRQVLPLELKGETAQEADELQFEALPADDRVLALWMKKKVLAEFITTFAGAGWEPAVVTTPLLYRRYLVPQQEPDAAFAVADAAGVAVFSAAQPVYFRPFRSGTWKSELERTLAALELGKGLEVPQVYLIGDQAEEAVSLQGKEGERVYFPLSCDEVGDADLYAVACAVAEGDVADFRHGEFAYRGQFDQLMKKLRLTAILAGILGLLLIAEGVVRYTFVRRDLLSLDKSIAAIYRDAFPGRRKAVDEVAELKAEIRRLGGTMPSVGVLTVLRRVSEAKTDDIIGIYEAEVEGGKLQVKGDARSTEAVAQFKGRLAPFMDAEVTEMKSNNDGSVSFILRGAFKEGAK